MLIEREAASPSLATHYTGMLPGWCIQQQMEETERKLCEEEQGVCINSPGSVLPSGLWESEKTGIGVVMCQQAIKEDIESGIKSLYDKQKIE